MRPHASSLLFFAVLLAVLVPFRFAAPVGPGPYGVDASYYYQIARHVAEGDGLQTSVSIFHEGAARLPTPTRIYPLWPLLLGVAGRAIGLHTAARILLPALYFLDLILLYFLADRVARRMGGDGGEIVLQRGDFVITVGHLAAAVFATNPLLFLALGDPYTEGLAFACAFGSLLLIERNSRLLDLLSGIAAACAFLSRSQMAVFAAGVGAVLLYRAIRAAGARRVFLAWTAGAVLPVALWYVWLARHFPLSALNPFAGISPFFKYSQVPIEPFVWWVPAHSVTEWLADRLPGIAVAFDPRSEYSYFGSFGAVAAIVPLALLAWIVRTIRHRRPGGAVDPLVAAIVAGGVAANVVLLHFHGWHFLPWLFGWRHGLPYIFLVVVSFAYLAKISSSAVRALLVVLALVSATTGVVYSLRVAATKRPVTGAEQALIRWIGSQPKTPTILTTEAQILGMLTRANYHWTHCRETSEQTRRMLQHLPIDYILVYRRNAPCTFKLRLGDVVEPHMQFQSPGDSILVLRRKHLPAGNTTGGR